MKKSLIYVAIGLLVSMLSVSAYAGKQCPKEMAKNKISKMDSNGDGTVSRDEWLENAGAHFDKMDANGDGAVTEEEIVKKHKAKMKAKKEKKEKNAKK